MLDGTLTGAGVHSGYGNQDGFYTVRYAADGAANVMFVDYAAGVETCLCASPNCTHDSEACTSWCGCPANIPDVFPAGDRLVWVYLGNPEYVDEYGDAARCRIEVSGLDGAGRENVQLLPPPAGSFFTATSAWGRMRFLRWRLPSGRRLTA